MAEGKSDYYNTVKDRTGITEWLGDFLNVMLAAEEDADAYSGLRVDGTLREFKRFKPVDIWFKFPIHEVDTTGMLQDIKPDEESRSRSNRNLKKSGKRADKTPEERKNDARAEFEEIFGMLDVEGRGKVKVDEFLRNVKYKERTLKDRLKLFDGKYSIDSNGYLRNN